jgi:hypothetical protein
MCEVLWIELAIKLTSIEDAARIKGVPCSSAKSKLALARRSLRKSGWQFVNEERGEDIVIVQAIPPPGYEPDAWVAEQNRTIQTGDVREEQSEHWQVKERDGRPVLTWREMVILGWSNNRAQDHRGTLSYGVAANRMQEARAKLRKQGWHFKVSGKSFPPPRTEKTPDYIREIADAQQKSNWYLRLPASAGLTRGK